MMDDYEHPGSADDEDDAIVSCDVTVVLVLVLVLMVLLLVLVEGVLL